jgi:hypothetical protein
MDFSELSKKMGGLTAEQIFELATLGKGILNMYGSVDLASNLTNLVSHIITVDDFDIEENKYAIDAVLRISKMLSALNAKCWGERKTMLGLTGVHMDNAIYGLGNAEKIEDINLVRKAS